ncbi:MAG: CHAT domain-containing protein, partial [Planctomycetota bacterium]
LPDLGAASRELFEALIPAAVWQRLRTQRRVFVAGHRDLHRVPFELLVIGTREGVPVYWLDEGPEVAYVPSGSALHWLRRRPAGNTPARLDVLAIGDPGLDGATTAASQEPGRKPSVLATPAVNRGPGDFQRHDDLERLSRLPRLQGARAEAEAIVAAFRGKERPAELLLGDAATEPAVFARAATARYLHFACHGVAEEYAGQSLSMLVLAAPTQVAPGDDGLLKLTDLFGAWRGRLAACRLVVLSACRTNVGPTLRDEAPQALPLGFLFAGVRAVISSLWAVDDASTRELMVAFYQRLAAGGTDPLGAFTAARKALRAKYPDPFHWAPFLFLGLPE